MAILRKVTVCIFILLSIGAYAQKEEVNRSFGISGTIQGSQFGMNFPIWCGDHFVLAPALQFSYFEDAGADYGIAIAPRYYFKNTGIAPYAGMRAGMLVNEPVKKSNFDSAVKTTDYIVGLAFGGDYFLHDNFSFGVELQANLSISDENSFRFNNPGKTGFNTATMISASVYF